MRRAEVPRFVLGDLAGPIGVTGRHEFLKEVVIQFRVKFNLRENTQDMCAPQVQAHDHDSTAVMRKPV